jgi:hypothetical protein
MACSTHTLQMTACCYSLLPCPASAPASRPPAAHELQLPPCTREDRWVALSSVETLCYQQSKRAFCDAAYQLAQHQGAVAANVRGGLATEGLLLLVLLHCGCSYMQTAGQSLTTCTAAESHSPDVVMLCLCCLPAVKPRPRRGQARGAGHGSFHCAAPELLPPSGELCLIAHA